MQWSFPVLLLVWNRTENIKCHINQHGFLNLHNNIAEFNISEHILQKRRADISHNLLFLSHTSSQEHRPPEVQAATKHHYHLSRGLNRLAVRVSFTKILFTELKQVSGWNSIRTPIITHFRRIITLPVTFWSILWSMLDCSKERLWGYFPQCRYSQTIYQLFNSYTL